MNDNNKSENKTKASKLNPLWVSMAVCSVLAIGFAALALSGFFSNDSGNISHIPQSELEATLQDFEISYSEFEAHEPYVNPEDTTSQLHRLVNVNGISVENQMPTDKATTRRPSFEHSQRYFATNEHGHSYSLTKRTSDDPAAIDTILTKFRGDAVEADEWYAHPDDNGYVRRNEGFEGDAVWEFVIPQEATVYDVTENEGFTAIVGQKFVPFTWERDGQALPASAPVEFIALLNTVDGSLLWERTALDSDPDKDLHDYYSSYRRCVITESSIVVFGGEWHSGIIITTYGFDGNVIGEPIQSPFSKSVESIVGSAAFNDDWIVALGGITGNALGTANGWHSYANDDMALKFTGMALYNGKLYVSGYYTPNNGRRYQQELFELISVHYSNRQDDYMNSASAAYDGYMYFGASAVCPGSMNASQADKPLLEIDGLTELAREYYTAIMLVIDPVTLVPESYYTISGCVGLGVFATVDGRLVWETGSITGVAKLQFSDLSLETRLFNYTFSESGLLTSEKTAVSYMLHYP